MVFDCLDHDDGVVYNQAYGKHQAHESNGVNAETQKREHGESGNERHRNGECRNERGTPSLEEDENDDDHQEHRLVKGLQDLFDALTDRKGGIKGNLIVEVWRKGLLYLVHQFLHSSTAWIAFVPGS